MFPFCETKKVKIAVGREDVEFLIETKSVCTITGETVFGARHYITTIGFVITVHEEINPE